MFVLYIYFLHFDYDLLRCGFVCIYFSWGSVSFLTCCFISVINYRKCSTIITSVFLALSACLSIPTTCMLYILKLPHSSYSFFSNLLPLHFSLGSCCWPISMLTFFFFAVILHLCQQLSWFRSLSFDASFLSAYIIYLLYVFYIRVFNILITAILNFLCQSSICVKLESVSDDHFVSANYFLSTLLNTSIFCWKLYMINQIRETELNRLLVEGFVFIWLGVGLCLVFTDARDLKLLYSLFSLLR